MKPIPMQFPYGAVYFRKSNPPKEDWARDHEQAAQDGNNIFRHWFMWGSIEVAPGRFDWDDYDEQMELARKNGIKVIIAEMDNTVPQWLYHDCPELLCRKADGSVPRSVIGASTATGGFGAPVCLDNPQARSHMENFLAQLAARYRSHEALLGYDVWNECSTPADLCFCAHTRAAFQAFLRRKYGTLENLGRTWHRYSYTDWSQVSPPAFLMLCPECFDWFEFKHENAYAQMKWRVDVLRAHDPESLICAHGMAASLEGMPLRACDDWAAAGNAEVYGLTFVQSRKGAQSWKQFNAVDMTRCAARGKTIWHAESQAGPLWLQPQVLGRPKEDGRVTAPEDLRVWNLTSMACGARGILCPRWRPLLDGPLFGAFGGYGMDGSPTPISDMAGRIARWANAPEQKPLMEASCVRGEVGILLVPETQSACLLLSQFGSPDSYKAMATGAYRAFFDVSVQPDWVRMEDMGNYRALYLPCPVMLTQEHADMLKAWVRKGGRLVSEGCPGYFGDHGHVGTTQPNLGLDELFGVRQANVEFMPDLFESLSITVDGAAIAGGEYVQTYRVTSGTACGKTDDGSVVAARNRFGRGETLLIGTSVAKGYARDVSSRGFFASLLDFYGVRRHAEADNPNVQARIHQSESGVYLWLINQSAAAQQVTLQISDAFETAGVRRLHWGEGLVYLGEGRFRALVPARDAIIAQV